VEPLPWGPGVQEGRFKDQGLTALLKGLGASTKGLCVVTTRVKLTDLGGLSDKKVRMLDLGNLRARDWTSRPVNAAPSADG
jgi:hypothetical protein